MAVDPAEHIHIVLVRTTHPGNIGATARAMKTMGVRNLELVAPAGFPSAEVTARAAGADDILARARVHETLADAVSPHKLIFATSARVRSIPWPLMDPEEAAGRLVQHVLDGGRAAVLFGRESSGLSNRDLELCNGVIRIPTDPGFASLNIASAVQIVCYELRKQLDRITGPVPPRDPDAEPVSAEQMERFYEHLEAALVDIGFLDPKRPRRLMHRLRRLFNRTQLDQNEYNILRGVIAAAQKQEEQKPD